MLCLKKRAPRSTLDSALAYRFILSPDFYSVNWGAFSSFLIFFRCIFIAFLLYILYDEIIA